MSIILFYLSYLLIFSFCVFWYYCATQLWHTSSYYILPLPTSFIVAPDGHHHNSEYPT
jgi:hypothetical protein